MWSLMSSKWRESVPPIISPGATSVPGNTSRTVRLISWYEADWVGETFEASLHRASATSSNVGVPITALGFSCTWPIPP
jgi:hypothetical protein